MADKVIKAEGLGKKYKICHEEAERYTALRDVIARKARGLFSRGRDTAAQNPSVEDFWALDNVSFEVERGEVLGIIGRNGAGKSTLLKVLSRIVEPTTGRVEIDGRVASLLEVGTGFHPELTGRENIYLNGSILGMSALEVRKKFDEIVAFAEVERFLDTPVKRFSSGMYMRLAFAVAAHLEPEILIVDEVLAVGDVAFQKKCLGRMEEVRDSGRTVLFVSHNIGSLLSLCDTGLLLDAGRVVFQGSIEAAAQRYKAQAANGAAVLEKRAFHGPLKSVTFEQILLNGTPLSGHRAVLPEEELVFVVRGYSTEDIPDFRVGLALFSDGTRVLTTFDGPENLNVGPFETTFAIPAYLLRPGDYMVALGGRRTAAGDKWTWATDLACVEVIPKWDEKFDPEDTGLINVPCGRVRTSMKCTSNLLKKVG
jgi:lipopolysaccharide transport system ATP-binding protein